MLILLPPSESKNRPYRGRPMDLAALSEPALAAAREQVLTTLVDLCADEPARAAEVLGLAAGQRDLVSRNARLRNEPAAPASRIYSGVLYAALDLPGLAGQDLRRANRRVRIVSALLGLVRPADRIIAYRLSGSTTLPGIGALTRFWRAQLTPLVGSELIVDLLSSPYRSMITLPNSAITIKIWQQGPGGQRTAVSHHNKSAKGSIARTLATATRPARTLDDVADALAEAGWHLDIDKPARRVDVYLAH